MSSRGHAVTQSDDQVVIQSCSHTLIYSYDRVVIRWYIHTIVLSYDHVFIRSCSHTIMQSYDDIFTRSCSHTMIYSYDDMVIVRVVRRETMIETEASRRLRQRVVWKGTSRQKWTGLLGLLACKSYMAHVPWCRRTAPCRTPSRRTMLSEQYIRLLFGFLLILLVCVTRVYF